MKFLIIASHPISVLKFRGALLEEIRKKGYDVHIAAPDFEHHPNLTKQIESLGYTLHNISMQRTGTNPLYDFNTLKSLYNLIKSIRPNYILTYTIKPVIYGSLAAWLAKVPNIYALITGLGYTFQNIDNYDQRSLFQRLIHTAYQQALSKTNKVFFQNPDDLDLFHKLNLIKPTTATTVVNGSGVNTLEYNVAPIPMYDNEPEVRFLLIARLLGDKGVREYVQAAKTIKSKYPKINFDLVGMIDSNPSAIRKSELDSWVSEGVINYLGRLEDVRPAISDCSIFVLPSYREGTPRAVLEAMSMGRPIITTDAPGCRQTVENEVNGFLVPIKSVDKLVDSMEKFIKDRSLILRMGQKSREIAENKFDVAKVNHQMLSEMSL